MPLFRIPEITNEEIAKAAQSAEHIQHPVVKALAMQDAYHGLMIDKLNLPPEKKKEMSGLIAHKMRLSVANWQFQTNLPKKVLESLRETMRPDAVKILEKHRELSPADEKEVVAALEKLKAGSKPKDVLNPEFFDRSAAAAETRAKKVLGDADYLTWNDLQRQVMEKARALGLFSMKLEL